MEEVVKFNNYELNYNSGDLKTITNGKETEVNRLTPQSTKLLKLLIKKYPEILSKEEIKSRLWPDIEVDFDNSLHFCIRQIRLALNDNVANPEYIETIPRRGYKWLVEVEAPKKKQKLIPIFVFALIFLSWVSISVYYFKNLPENPNTEKVETKTSLVIMPFQTMDSLSDFYNNEIAYELLKLTGNNKEFKITGPSITLNIKPEEIYRYLENSKSEYLINAKFSGIGDESSLLIEIIRNKDMAHIWVKSFKADVSDLEIAEMILIGFEENRGK